MVATQLNTLMPVGTAIRKLAPAKMVSRAGLMPTANMWWAQTPKLMNPMATVAMATDVVAEDHLAGKDGDDLGDDAEGRQGHDVDLGMAEEPEEVLPQQGRAARLRVEEMGSRSCGPTAA